MRVEEALAVIDARIAELRRVEIETRNALEVLKSLREKNELLVPIGGGVFVRATWNGTSLIDVGGGIILEKKVEEIEERLEKRLQRIESEVKKLEEEKTKIIEQVRGQQ